MNTVCRFIPPKPEMDHIQMINFIYEVHPTLLSHMNPCPVYRVHLVTDGEGEIQCGRFSRKVKRGDVFFLFPAVSYGITGDRTFRYMYISFFGIRAAAELERLHIEPANFVFEGMGQLREIWERGMAFPDEVLDLISESVLLHTLSAIGCRHLEANPLVKDPDSARIFLQIKAFIDIHYAEPELTCQTLSEEFSYTRKYLSRLFTRHFQIGITEYITTVRINHAVALLEQTRMPIAEVAARVGFADPLYFSRVFKRKVGIPPAAYRKQADGRT